MKKLLFVCALSASLFSCSLLQRHEGATEEAAAEPATENGEADGPLFTPDGQEVTASKAGPSSENEVSRLNTKIAALETKVDVLSANLERIQAQRSQPIIQAEPQPSLAAPVDDMTEVRDQSHTEVSAAPARPSRVAPAPRAAAEPSAKNPTAAEKEFRAGMQMFQNGQNLEAASRFALMAKKFPHHLLASHALYWAGEAAARGQQWSIATENWAELEKKYPRSTYVPEALAGLARAWENQGDATKARLYRTMLMKAFPKSPVAMKAESMPALPTAAAPAPRAISRNLEAPAASEEPAPVFEEEHDPAGDQPAAAPTTESQ